MGFLSDSMPAWIVMALCICGGVVVLAVIGVAIWWAWKNMKKEPTLK